MTSEWPSRKRQLQAMIHKLNRSRKMASIASGTPYFSNGKYRVAKVGSFHGFTKYAASNIFGGGSKRLLSKQTTEEDAGLMRVESVEAAESTAMDIRAINRVLGGMSRGTFVHNELCLRCHTRYSPVHPMTLLVLRALQRQSLRPVYAEFVVQHGPWATAVDLVCEKQATSPSDVPCLVFCELKTGSPGRFSTYRQSFPGMLSSVPDSEANRACLQASFALELSRASGSRVPGHPGVISAVPYVIHACESGVHLYRARRSRLDMFRAYCSVLTKMSRDQIKAAIPPVTRKRKSPAKPRAKRKRATVQSPAKAPTKKKRATKPPASRKRTDRNKEQTKS